MNVNGEGAAHHGSVPYNARMVVRFSRSGVVVFLLLAAAGLILWRLAAAPPPEPGSGDRDRRPIEDAGSEDPAGGADERREADAPDEDSTSAARTDAAIHGRVRIVAGGLGGEEPEDQGPAAGARVELYRHRLLLDRAPWLRTWHNLGLVELGPRPEDLVASTTAGADGRFRFPHPGDETWLVVAERAGLMPVATEWADGDGEITLGLARPTRTFLIRDLLGGAVPGAVAVDPYADQGVPIRADGAGTISVALEKGVGHVLIVRAPGHATTRVEFTDAPDPSVIVLPPGAPLAGVVVDAAGKPVEGASVHLSRPWGEVIITGPDGKFRFEGLPVELDVGTLGLLAEKEGFFHARAGAAPGDTGVRLALGRRGEIRGRVVRPDGSAANGATVHWRHPDSGQSDRETVGGEGEFALGEIPAGTVVLSSVLARPLRPEDGSPRYPTHEVRLVFTLPDGAEHDLGTLTLRALPVSFVLAKVVDPGGNPVARVTVSGPGRSLSRDGLSDTDTSGLLLKALRLPPGTRTTYRARTDPPGEASGEAEVVSSADPDAPPQVISLRPPGRLTVRILGADGTKLPEDLEVTLRVGDADPESVRGPHVLATTADLGRPLRIVAWARGCATAVETFAPDARKAREVELRLLPGAVIRGRLVPAGGRTAGGAVVRAVCGSFRDLDRHVRMKTDETGGFALEAVPAGRVWLFACPDWHSDGVLVRTVDVDPGETLDLGEVPVRPAGQATGRVLGPDARPLGGATVTYRTAVEPSALAIATSDPDGRFSIPVAATPGGLLEIRKEGLGRAFLPLPRDPASTPLVARLRPEGRLRVRLTPDDRGASWPRWELSLADGAARWVPFRTIVPGPDGEEAALIRGLPDEPVRLTVRRRDGAGRMAEGRVVVHVPPGATRDVRLTLE